MSEKKSKRLSTEVDGDEGRASNHGDWVCVDTECGNVNFAKRSCCNRCGKERGECSKKKKLGQEIGKAAAEKSRGLFSADDWQCNKCGNVNWARRQQCNMCNAPKFGDAEERTGYGGGYNDRGVVEYKDRREEDDEYDEFGRRRKKRRVESRSDDDSKDSSKYSSPPCSRSKNLESKNYEEDEDKKDSEPLNEENENEVEDDDEQEEEEEEDDEDDGDLSKYDLSEWDDFAAAKKNLNGNAGSSEEHQSR